VQIAILVVVETGTAQVAILQSKAQRFYQVQLAAGIAGKANDVAGVGRNLWLVQHKVEHKFSCEMTGFGLYSKLLGATRTLRATISRLQVGPLVGPSAGAACHQGVLRAARSLSQTVRDVVHSGCIAPEEGGLLKQSVNLYLSEFRK
jgi:hypothetical protein